MIKYLPQRVVQIKLVPVGGLAKRCLSAGKPHQSGGGGSYCGGELPCILHERNASLRRNVEGEILVLTRGL